MKNRIGIPKAMKYQIFQSIFLAAIEIKTIPIITIQVVGLAQFKVQPQPIDVSIFGTINRGSFLQT